MGLVGMSARKRLLLSLSRTENTPYNETPTKGPNMDRNAFAMDLLKPGITVEELFESFMLKRELTQEDLFQISDVAAQITLAASKAIPLKQ
jgi:hypothetical protein